MSVGVYRVELGTDVGAWFTGRDRHRAPAGPGQPGNLAHRRPHAPAELARDRREVGNAVGYPPDRWHFLHQVHGAQVATIDERTPVGSELRSVDGAVTRLADRPLVVQVADCVPVLLAGDGLVGVAHAGRRGVEAGVVDAVVTAARSAGARPADLLAAIGPAIGPCCYEVPAELAERVAATEPVARATTTWDSPSLDLPGAVVIQLRRSGVTRIANVGTCTRCDPRWFSHRADPRAGRQVGLVVRRGGPAAETTEIDIEELRP